MKKKLIYSAIVLVVIVFTAELLVRIWLPQDLISDIIEFDEELCHKLKSNITGVQNSKEYKVKLKINNLGLRDRPYTKRKEKNTFRILILGDSHTFGWGIKLENIFSEILENKLNLSHTNPNFEVLNCGVYGYGTGHQYQFLKSIGFDFEPDLVIIAMDFMHDIKVNNSGYYYFENDQLLRTKKTCSTQKSRAITKYIPFSSFFRGHSHLFRFCGLTLYDFYRIIFKSENKQHNDQSKIYKLDFTLKIFAKLKKDLNSKGIKLAIVILPEFNSKKEQPKSEPVFYKRLDALENFFALGNYHFVSLQEDFDKQLNSNFTFNYSHHFKTKGHQFIANEIEDFLNKSQLVKN